MLVPQSHSRHFWLLAWLLLAGPAARAQFAPPTFDYVRPVGTPAEEHQPYTFHDAQGTDWLVGFFEKTFQIGGFTLTSAGGIDLYVARFDPDGTCRWATRAGGPGDDFYQHGAIDQLGNAYLTGFTTSSQLQLGPTPALATTGTGRLFALRLGANGQWRWGQLLGASAADALTALTTDRWGSAYVAGLLGGPSLTVGTTTLSSPATGFLARLDSTGAWPWALPTTAAVRVAQLATDAADHLYAAGTLTGSGSAGPFSLASAGGADILVAQLATATGAWQWARRAGGTADDAATMLLCQRSHLYLAGHFASPDAQFGTLPAPPLAGAADAFVARLTPAGAFEWVTPGGSALADAAYLLTADAAGGIYAGGQYSAPATFGGTQLPHLGGPDLFVAKLDSTGQYQWATAVGSDDEDQLFMLTSTGLPDDLLLSGYFFANTLYLPPLTFPNSSGGAQGFLTRLTASSLLLRSVSPGSGQPGQVVQLTGTRLGGVRQVYFNGTASPALSAQSATSLRAVVPAGFSSGPLSVRNAAGTTASGPTFYAQVLGTLAAAQSAAPLAWPIPIRAAEPLHLKLAGPTAAYFLHTALGTLARTGQVSAANSSLPTAGLAPGLYFLTLIYPASPASTVRLVVE